MPESQLIESKDVSRGTILDRGLMPMSEAAELLGCDLKRLRGWVWRNSVSLDDPIGCLKRDEVYGWSCRAIPRRLADHSSGGAS
jgi:hypothetical protein